MGDNLAFTDLGTNLDVKQVALNDRFACALFTNKKIKCWGRNSNGQLGIGDISGSNLYIGDEPNEMGDNLAFIDLGTNVTVEQISIGFDFVCALCTNKKIKCWGQNDAGQLGIGDNSGSNSKIGDQPNEMGDNLTFVDLGTNLTVEKISLANRFACAKFTNKKIKCWGYNGIGITGIIAISFATAYIGDQPNEMGDNLPFINLGTGPCPTPDPTDFPTIIPTNDPTRLPTQIPSNAPTIIPTNHPSQNPSNSPTTSPTKHPTSETQVSKDIESENYFNYIGAIILSIELSLLCMFCIIFFLCCKFPIDL